MVAWNPMSCSIYAPTEYWPASRAGIGSRRSVVGCEHPPLGSEDERHSKVISGDDSFSEELIYFSKLFTKFLQLQIWCDGSSAKRYPLVLKLLPPS